MENTKGFMTPPNHIKFSAKKLFGAAGMIADGAIAYLEPGGGGPTEPHTHAHDHLFIVTEGEATIISDGEKVKVSRNESYLVKGMIPHSVWNETEGQTAMIGISVAP